MDSDRLVLQWQDIKYSATDPKDKSTMKEIVKGISGEVVAGEMIAILGPSGAGKTSFLDILAGRLGSSSSAKVSGTILLNGEVPSASKYARISGYVKQEDLFFASSTVREAIRFSARLRLPQTMSDEEVDAQVQKTIDELGLTKVADSKIGGETMRGISGGERKRTAVGVELVRQAKLLFLDEMTTGLDSAMSLTLVSTLRQVADNNRAIVCTVHQPRWSILKQFDKIMLLAQGNVVYFGPTMKAVEYFADLGLNIKKFENPGDFLVDHIRVNRATNVVEYENSVPQEELDRLVNAFKPYNKLSIDTKADNSLIMETEIPETATWYMQFKMVLERGLRAVFRDPLIGTSEIFLYFIMGIIVWLIFWGLSNDQSGIQDRTKVIFTVIVGAGFTPAFAIVVYFPAERAVFNRERAGRFYATSAYYLASSLATVPVQLIGSTLMVLMTYWAVGLSNTAENFFLFYVIVLLTALASDALGVAISAIAPSFSAGNLIASLTIMLWLPFCSILVTDVHPWLYPLQYTSLFKYATEATLQNEFTTREFVCPPSPCPVSPTVTLGNQTVPTSDINLDCNLPCLFNNYQDYSNFFNLDTLTVGENIAVLVSFLIFFRVIGYLCMRFLKIGKS